MNHIPSTKTFFALSFLVAVVTGIMRFQFPQYYSPQNLTNLYITFVTFTGLAVAGGISMATNAVSLPILLICLYVILMLYFGQIYRMTKPLGELSPTADSMVESYKIAAIVMALLTVVLLFRQYKIHRDQQNSQKLMF